MGAGDHSFAKAGRQVIALAADPNWIGEQITMPASETQRLLETVSEVLSCLFGAMVGAVLLVRIARYTWQRRRGFVRISYPDGRIVGVTPGTSVLGASLASPGSRMPPCTGVAVVAPLPHSAPRRDRQH
jgi:adenylate cyclase